jgi:DNA-binding MarR family transcriptional regulator
MLNRFEQFVASISCISRYIQKIERDEMARYGLKGPHAQYLIAMNRFPEGVTAAQLSGICEKDKAAVSRAVSELENGGLIYRAIENASGYRAMLKLTEHGRTAAVKLMHMAEIAVEKAGAGLNDEDRATFYAALNRIAGNLRQISLDGL